LRAPRFKPPRVNIYADGLEAMKMSASEFYNAVKSGGKWDFKRLDRKYEDYGNYHFGWVAEAFGIYEGVALCGAGLYQIKTGTAKLEWWMHCGDDPNDQYWIDQGYKDRPGEWTDRMVLTAGEIIDKVVEEVGSWF